MSSSSAEITPLAKQLNDEACKGIEATVRRSTIGIVVGSGDRKWQEMGTGTLILWKGRHLILTAEHVLEDTQPEDLRFIFPREEPPIEVERETLQNLPGVPTSLIRPVEKIELGQLVRDPELDLATIAVNGNLNEKYPCDFSPLKEGGRTPAEGQPTLIVGFPFDITRETNNNEIVAISYLEWTEILPDGDPERLKDYDPAKHFLTRFNQADAYPEASPKGMSGAAMWFHTEEKTAVWRPNVDIAGVAIGYFSRPKLQVSVRREFVEEFLNAKVSR